MMAMNDNTLEHRPGLMIRSWCLSRDAVGRDIVANNHGLNVTQAQDGCGGSDD